MKFNWILRGEFMEMKMSNDEFVTKLKFSIAFLYSPVSK